MCKTKMAMTMAMAMAGWRCIYPNVGLVQKKTKSRCRQARQVQSPVNRSTHYQTEKVVVVYIGNTPMLTIAIRKVAERLLPRWMLAAAGILRNSTRRKRGAWAGSSFNLHSRRTLAHCRAIPNEPFQPCMSEPATTSSSRGLTRASRRGVPKSLKQHATPCRLVLVSGT